MNNGNVLITSLGGTPVLSKSLFEQITDMQNIEKAYNQALKGKNKYNTEAIKFSMNETYNLQQLRQILIDGTYEFDGYINFKVYEPKERIIDAPHFKDKIVQLAVNNVIKQVYQPSFIHDSYACIDDKGTHKAVDRVSYFMRKAGWEYGENASIIKLDVRKFFYSIDREALKSRLPKKIKCERTLSILYKIINSADMIDFIGLPLGNTLSQIFANIMMDMLDQYCKRVLSLNYYVRYADDVICIAKDKDEANRVLGLMVEFLNNEVKLDINEHKTKIFPIEQGVNAYGFKIYKTHRLLRNDSKKKIKRKAKKFRRLLVEEKITVEKVEQILNSWYGHAKHGDSYNFIKRLIERNDYICMNGKEVLKVNVDIIEKERGLIATS